MQSFRGRCEQCGCAVAVEVTEVGAEEVPERCVMCVSLGARSLVGFMRAMSQAVGEVERSEVRVMFRAAVGRRVTR